MPAPLVLQGEALGCEAAGLEYRVGVEMLAGMERWAVRNQARRDRDAQMAVPSVAPGSNMIRAV